MAGTLAVANGGTGATTQAAAQANLLPAQAGNAGKVLATDGAGVLSWATAGGTGTVTNVTGTAPIAVATGTTTPVVSITPGTARQLMQTNAGGTAAEFTSNVDVPGTLDVTGVGTFDANLRFNSGYGSAAVAYGCRAWVNFDGVPASPTIRAGGNVSSVTKSGTGVYIVNFTTAMPDANFGAAVTCNSLSNGTTVTFGSIGQYADNSTNPATTTSLNIRAAGSGGSAFAADSAFINVIVFR
jgi:hypothetical protein